MKNKKVQILEFGFFGYFRLSLSPKH